MELSNNTVLITGGSSGIGLQLSKCLILAGNTVIICGKSNDKLMAAKATEPKLITYQCDLSVAKERSDFAALIIQNHPTLNFLINNAAVVNRIDFLEHDLAMELAEQEYQTNLLAPIHLIKLLHSTIRKNKNPTIINITTGLIYAPRVVYPFYNSSKSALHSFTQTLRVLLKDQIKVVEVMFPAVDTPWHKGTPPKIAISATDAVNEMIKELKKDNLEIRIKGVKLLYLLSRIAPAFAFKKINQIR